MKSNPGGQIAPGDIIGRDSLVRRLWRVLEGRSVVLSAERRVGKTCVIQKMRADAPEGTLAIYRDLEQVQSTLEFAELVFHDVEGYLSGLKRTAERVRLFLSHLEGAEIASVLKFPKSVAAHWKTLLTKTLEDLVTHQDRRLVFLWDEVPLMLYKIRQNEGETSAMEVLDVLRSLRQTHPTIRMIFTGSIGLHNVLSSLKRAGYANDPTNDMALIEVSPLSPLHGAELATRLIEGEGIKVVDPDKTSKAIADAVDCIPYFIHHVVDQMTQREGPLGVSTVTDIVESCISDQNDCWHLNYYRERIAVYYDHDHKSIALALLDILAVSESLRFEDLFNLLKSRMVTEDSETLLEVLTHLRRDHYVTLDTNGKYLFGFPLIKRFWFISRGLSR